MSIDQGKFGINHPESLGQGSFGRQQQNTQEDSWVCPNCETVNTENTCILCGYNHKQVISNHRQQQKKILLLFVGSIIAFASMLIAFFLKDNANVVMLEPNSNVLSSDIVALEDLGYCEYATRPVFGKNIMRDQIASITFLSTKKNAPDDAWDVSQAKNQSVVAWMEKNGELYDMYIAGEGGVTAPSNCQTLFALYSNAKYINFNNSFSTANVTNMHDMFLQCQNLEALDLRGFNTSKTTSMRAMFHLCSNLQKLDLSSFTTSKVTDMGWMFSDCSDLTEITITGFDTKNVKDMGCMFYNCNSITKLDLNNFDTTNVTNMSFMFGECGELGHLDVSSFNTANVTDMECMFYKCDSLTKLNISNFDTGKVENVSGMFYGCTSFENIDISGLDFTNVSNHVNFMNKDRMIDGKPWQMLFQSASETIPVWKNNILMGPEYYYDGLEQISYKSGTKEYLDSCSKISVFNSEIPRHKINSVTFLDTLNKAPETSWDVSESQDGAVLAWVTETNGELLDLFIAGEGGVNGVLACEFLFSNYINVQSIDFNECFYTEDCTSMMGMFMECNKLESLNLQGFDTSNVEWMAAMFRDCHSLMHLDVSEFDTSSVIYMQHMFNNCTKLENVDITNFDFSKVEKYHNFMNEEKLIDGKPWQTLFQ